MPVYFVIVKMYVNPQWAAIWHIVKVIEGNYSPDYYSHIWRMHVEPLLPGGEQYQMYVFIREPDNPFREYKAKQE